ncbi:MAG TPA: YceI family protein [Candidatus Dormibacteraeota bacterium]|nr:YceI family protein [Candidatus Dormibacteraeota bacterium]
MVLLLTFGTWYSSSVSGSQAPELAAGREILLTVDPEQSKAHWSLGSTLHTVHGTFHLKRGTMRIDTVGGKATGEIVADATSGESGNASRDQKMHKDVLESGRYKEVMFRPDHVEGKVSLDGVSNVQIHGILYLHGTEHELSVPLRAELAGNRWKASGSFSVPYVQWGLKNPSNFLLKVNSAVDVGLEMSGTLQSATG